MLVETLMRLIVFISASHGTVKPVDDHSSSSDVSSSTFTRAAALGRKTSAPAQTHGNSRYKPATSSVQTRSSTIHTIQFTKLTRPVRGDMSCKDFSCRRHSRTYYSQIFSGSRHLSRCR
ncbi:hypothetical protein EDD16DRAFT_124212 [Pisolithus croceorrhizus]|nr:hypothetical protein EDD16DRAFT_124212 [Pisolithus croceorrhizus]